MIWIVLAGCTQATGPGAAPIPSAQEPSVVPEVAPVEAPDPEPAPAEDAVPKGQPAGAACMASSDCASGICEGEGCDEASPGVCADAERMCTADVREYCGCDEQTFQGSGSCPGARYAHDGPCEEAPQEGEPTEAASE